MKKVLLITVCFMFLIVNIGNAAIKKHQIKKHSVIKNAKNISWGYSGAGSPENWGKLDKSFSICSEGKNQSPVNLTAFVKTAIKNIYFNYNTYAAEILNNGHAIEVNYSNGSTITVDKTTFELKKIIFHAPSENTVEGRSYPMEAQLIHSDKHGNIAIIAVLLTEGSENEFIKTLWTQLPKKSGEKNSLAERLNVNNMLPMDRHYFRFSGSLTTPPCTEGVRWFIFKNAITISKEQIKTFTDVMHDNNRPVQQINGRVILR
ncbi:MAG: carbonic anhydrase family protein [Nitrospirae bacterium]|nr:carbonic anhydrase family protein [Nitrospirota bacterium]